MNVGHANPINTKSDERFIVQPCKVISESNLCQRGQLRGQLQLEFECLLLAENYDDLFLLLEFECFGSKIQTVPNNGPWTLHIVTELIREEERTFFSENREMCGSELKKTRVSSSFIGQEIKQRVLVFLLTSRFIL